MTFCHIFEFWHSFCLTDNGELAEWLIAPDCKSGGRWFKPILKRLKMRELRKWLSFFFAHLRLI